MAFRNSAPRQSDDGPAAAPRGPPRTSAADKPLSAAEKRKTCRSSPQKRNNMTGDKEKGL